MAGWPHKVDITPVLKGRKVEDADLDIGSDLQVWEVKEGFLREVRAQRHGEGRAGVSQLKGKSTVVQRTHRSGESLVPAAPWRSQPCRPIWRTDQAGAGFWG